MKKEISPVNNLTLKQKRFCEEYLKDYNATRAAIRAGYSSQKINAANSAARLFKKEIVRAYIKLLVKEMAEQSGATAERVIRELARCAFANIKDYMDANGNVVNPASLDADMAAAISSIKITETETGASTGKPVIKRTIEIKLNNKLVALEKLARYLGLFDKEGNLRFEGNRDEPVIGFPDGKYIKI